ncbi:MAG: PAS domain-containing protein [Nitrospira sp.]
MSSPSKKDPTGLLDASGYQTGLADLIDGAPGGVALLALDCRLVYANRVSKALLGRATRLVDVLHPDDRKPFEFAVTRLRLDPSLSQRLEMRFVKADGSDVWVMADLFVPAPAAMAGSRKSWCSSPTSTGRSVPKPRCSRGRNAGTMLW